MANVDRSTQAEEGFCVTPSFSIKVPAKSSALFIPKDGARNVGEINSVKTPSDKKKPCEVPSLPFV
jgi:hypothetical protein